MITKKGLKLSIIFTVVVLGSVLTGLLTSAEQKDENSKKEQKMYRKLTAEERRVIVHKGTETPFTGEYVNNFEKGVYVCRRCSAELFESDAKFKSECGWPSFDEQIPGAVIFGSRRCS